MKKRSILLLTGFCLATMAAWGQQADPNQAPTLADIARQKRAQKAKKVYTTEDMKAAPEEPAPAATEGSAPAKPEAPKSTEAIAAAQAKVEDLRYREVVLNKNIARFETSLATAQGEGNEDRAKTYQESIDSAKASLAEATEQRLAAEKALDEMKAAAAAAAAAPKRPARKTTAPKS